MNRLEPPGEKAAQTPAYTDLCFSADSPDAPERRAENRHLSVLRVAKLMAGGREAPREELCLIRNISAGGMMAHVYTRFTVNDAVRVELKTAHEISGHIVWIRDGAVGIQFDEKIDVAQILASDRGHKVPGFLPRPPRLSVRVPACIAKEGTYRPANVSNISLGGVKIDHAQWLEKNDKVCVIINGLLPLNGVVRWRKDNHAGIAFLPTIAFDTLARWASESIERQG